MNQEEWLWNSFPWQTWQYHGGNSHDYVHDWFAHVSWVPPITTQWASRTKPVPGPRPKAQASRKRETERLQRERSETAERKKTEKLERLQREQSEEAVRNAEKRLKEAELLARDMLKVYAAHIRNRTIQVLEDAATHLEEDAKKDPLDVIEEDVAAYPVQVEDAGENPNQHTLKTAVTAAKVLLSASGEEVSVDGAAKALKQIIPYEELQALLTPCRDALGWQILAAGWSQERLRDDNWQTHTTTRSQCLNAYHIWSRQVTSASLFIMDMCGNLSRSEREAGRRGRKRRQKRKDPKLKQEQGYSNEDEETTDSAPDHATACLAADLAALNVLCSDDGGTTTIAPPPGLEHILHDGIRRYKTDGQERSCPRTDNRRSS